MYYQDILERADEGWGLTHAQIEALLQPETDDELRDLFATARRVRDRRFGREVFVYGFVYFSTHCQNRCSFCLYRHGNPSALRYRKSANQVLEAADCLRKEGVHLVDLTMGEDPYYRTHGGFQELASTVSEIRSGMGVPVMVSPGVMSRPAITALSQAGADWLACYQETHHLPLFDMLRPGQNYQLRLDQKLWATEHGMLSEEGVLVGVGESKSNLAHSIMEMGRLGVQQVRAMAFVPQEGTPLEQRSAGSISDELIVIAVMRLVLPERLIPASLDIQGLDGMAPRLDAGANVVTSIIPCDSGLKGVAQHDLGILNGERSVALVRSRLQGLGYSLASMRDYADWIETSRPRTRRAPSCA